jgi:hypothetical protein
MMNSVKPDFYWNIFLNRSLIYSLERREANVHWAAEELLLHVWSPNVRCHVRKTPPVVPVLSQLNLVQIITLNLFNIPFNSIQFPERFRLFGPNVSSHVFNSKHETSGSGAVLKQRGEERALGPKLNLVCGYVRISALLIMWPFISFLLSHTRHPAPVCRFT